jgi:hypothetical protein
LDIWEREKVRWNSARHFVVGDVQIIESTATNRRDLTRQKVVIQNKKKK